MADQMQALGGAKFGYTEDLQAKHWPAV